MKHPNRVNMDLRDEPLEVFRVLYPIFKNEVFQRREHMMRLTAFSSTFLVLLLVAMFAGFPSSVPTSLTLWFAISGIMLFSGLFAYFILQHADRHRMAKQQLIELEQSLGLYQDGWKPNGDALFPKNWQADWVTDRSVTVYLTILAALTTLVICAILVQT
jgi:hypothetical protein